MKASAGSGAASRHQQRLSRLDRHRGLLKSQYKALRSTSNARLIMCRQAWPGPWENTEEESFQLNARCDDVTLRARRRRCKVQLLFVLRCCPFGPRLACLVTTDSQTAWTKGGFHRARTRAGGLISGKTKGGQGTNDPLVLEESKTASAQRRWIGKKKL